MTERPDYTQCKPDDEINLLDLIEILVKRWKMIAAITAAAAILSVIVSLLLPNVYTATARILPPQHDNSLMGLMMGMAAGGGGSQGGGIAQLLGKGTPADQYVAMMQSDAIGTIILDRFNLMKEMEWKYRVDALKMLTKKVSITAGKKDGLITISVDDKDPKRAADIANAYIEELSKLLGRINVAGSGTNRKFFEERLAQAKVDLARAEDALKSFQSRNKALDITEQAKGTIQGVAELMGQLAAEEVKLSALRQSLTDSSSEVKNQKAVISAIKAKIAQMEGSAKGGSIPAVGSVPALGQEYLRLMREFKTQETLVELLTKQYEILKLSETRDQAPLQVLHTAMVPDRKSKPKRSAIVMFSTLLASFCGVIAAFILEAGDKMTPESREQWNRIRGYLPRPGRRSGRAG